MTVAALSHQSRRAARRQGAWLSALIPLALVLVGNGLIFASGAEGGDPAFERLALAPPPWAVAAIWIMIYPLWGLARWKAARAGRRGSKESGWVVALMGWGLAYPLLTGFEAVPSAWANVVSLALAAVTFWRVSKVSHRAAWLIAPSVIWIAFATVLGFMALARP